ncbi:MAG: hypothetical protein NVSMB63_07770 [Sediminibacterium sp.]
MRLLKLVLISIAGLFLLATVITSLFPSQVIVSRAINMEAPADSILPYVKDIHQWKKWMEGMNEGMVIILSDTAAELGGTRVIITQISDTAVHSSWLNGSGNRQMGTINLIGTRVQKITVVQWQFQQQVRWYPWEKLGSIMNDKIMGTMMEKNLGNLKKLVEHQ